jgi:hypothetical protein
VLAKKTSNNFWLSGKYFYLCSPKQNGNKKNKAKGATPELIKLKDFTILRK